MLQELLIPRAAEMFTRSLAFTTSELSFTKASPCSMTAAAQICLSEIEKIHIEEPPRLLHAELMLLRSLFKML